MSDEYIPMPVGPNEETMDAKMKEFGELLVSMQGLDTKKKILWREIYENAVQDRMNAYILFTEAFRSMGIASTSEHITAGPILTKYIERMNKANDQLLKLADLIAKEEAESSKIDPNDLYNQMLKS